MFARVMWNANYGNFKTVRTERHSTLMETGLSFLTITSGARCTYRCVGRVACDVTLGDPDVLGARHSVRHTRADPDVSFFVLFHQNDVEGDSDGILAIWRGDGSDVKRCTSIVLNDILQCIGPQIFILIPFLLFLFVRTKWFITNRTYVCFCILLGEIVTW